VKKIKRNAVTAEFPVPEFIDPVFTKTSPICSFSVIQYERFGLVLAKTGSIISGTGVPSYTVKKVIGKNTILTEKCTSVDENYHRY
jgi:hypothetical protein